MKKIVLLSSLLLFVSLAVAAEEPTGLMAVPEPPEIPPQVESGAALEPEVTIIQSDKGSMHHYSINGRVYMVKVIPAVGPPYYMVDTNGDGELDARGDNIRSVAVPQWVLFSW